MAKRCVSLGIEYVKIQGKSEEKKTENWLGTWAPLQEDQIHHQGFGPSDILSFILNGQLQSFSFC